MGTYEELKAAVADVITTNGNNEITGALLQSTLLTIISTFGSGATFAGVATEDTTPGTPDQYVFYLAGAGVYPNFGGVEVGAMQLGIIHNGGGAWKLDTLTLDLPESIKAKTPQMFLPSVLYEAPDVSSIIYTDNIIYTNDDGKCYSVEPLLTDDIDTSLDVWCSGRLEINTPWEGVSIIAAAAAVDTLGNVINTAETTIITNPLPTTQATYYTLYIGDSVSMPTTGSGHTPTYFISQLMAAIYGLLPSVCTPVTVGSIKTGSYRYDGGRGASYRVMLGETTSDTYTSPFLNTAGNFSFSAYKTAAGIGTSHARVVVLSCGWDAINTADDAKAEFAAMQKLMQYFKEDYNGTVFVIEPILAPPTGAVEYTTGYPYNFIGKGQKLKAIAEFNRLCFEAYNDGAAENVFLGSLHLRLDRSTAFAKSIDSDNNTYSVMGELTTDAAALMAKRIAPEVIAAISHYLNEATAAELATDLQTIEIPTDLRPVADDDNNNNTDAESSEADGTEISYQ